MMNNAKQLSVAALAKMIDHSLLRPEMTEKEVKEGCALAARYEVATVCVRPYDTALCKELLSGTTVGVSVVVGFPHGNSSTAVKVYEAEQAMADGAVELDLVMPIGKVCSEDWDYVEKDVGAVIEAAHRKNVPVKVIFENHYLSEAQIVRCCRICGALQADFVKTSTGYAPTGALVEHVRLMRRSCTSAVSIKAAGGIRDLSTFLTLLAAGADRQGTRSTGAILEEALQLERQGRLIIPAE